MAREGLLDAGREFVFHVGGDSDGSSDDSFDRTSFLLCVSSVSHPLQSFANCIGGNLSKGWVAVQTIGC
jgi:hypothetical protein